MMRRPRFLLLVCAFAVCTAAHAPAQQADSPSGSALATRSLLRLELARLEAGGPHDRSAATLVRSRLASGDFQSGDRIFIRVEGEPQLTDTFTVNPVGELELPQLGTVPLYGVLRSELQERVQQHLTRFLRNPVLQVRPLIRLLIEGDVVRPGFYVVAPQQPLADVITEAGGLTQQARPRAMRVERGRELIWSGELLQQALGAGYSLDQLNLRAGDRVLVPQQHDADHTWRIVGILLSLPVAIYAISQIRH